MASLGANKEENCKFMGIKVGNNVNIANLVDSGYLIHFHLTS